MMDEIELQLCLSIGVDPVDEKQKPQQIQSSPGAQTQSQIQIQPQPQSQTRRGKRAASLGVEGLGDNDNDAYHGEKRDGEHGHSLPPSDQVAGHRKTGYKESEELGGPGGYLRLPPRKRVRTSLSFPAGHLKGQIPVKSRDNDTNNCSQGADTTAGEVTISRMAHIRRISATAPASTLLPASVPEMASGSVLGEIHDLPGLEEPSTLSMESGDTMDIDVGDEDTDLSTSIIPFPQYRAEDHLYPPHPSTQFPGAYMPAVLDSLSAQPADSTHQLNRFTIWEDPDDMDIDGVGFFDTEAPWYQSPEDDKENNEEDANQTPQEEHGDVQQRAHDLGHGHEYDFHLPEQEAYHHHLAPTAITEHRTLQGLETSMHARHEPAAPGEGPYPGLSSQQQFRRPERTRRNSVTDRADDEHPIARPHSSTISTFTFTPASTPASTPAPQHHHPLTLPHTPGYQPGVQHQQPLPSPTSLSATEVSLRALPNQTQPQTQTTEPNTATSPDARPFPDRDRSRRPQRRIIRSANLN